MYTNRLGSFRATTLQVLQNYRGCLLQNYRGCLEQLCRFFHITLNYTFPNTVWCFSTILYGASESEINTLHIPQYCMVLLNLR